MATDKKISDLPVASVISATDNSILVKSGTDYQFAFSTLLQFIGSELSVGASIFFGATLPQNISGKNGDVFINTAAGSIAQKISAVWTVVYTFPTGTAADGTVLYGTVNPGSITGKNNDTYINTLSGIFYKKSAGVWSQVFSMQTGPAGATGPPGAAGPAGINGKTILSGAGNPSNLYTGTDGDYYINTSTYDFFGPKAVGVWPVGFSLDNTDEEAIANEASLRTSADNNLQTQINELAGSSFNMKAYIQAAPTYADEAAALAGGIAAYTLYKTAEGELRYKLPNAVTPEPPTSGVVDDVANTFTYTGGEA
ncbi:hypothetical protein [Mucilaginibacter sp.]|uniref:hypothetical protein n=1 Tax=Mucilaginibacter sp. TaxID=1882438 RepID=UPI0025ED5DF2|nr:hypothetical protein [Mucilaginibacter sp.]